MVWRFGADLEREPLPRRHPVRHGEALELERHLFLGDDRRDRLHAVPKLRLDGAEVHRLAGDHLLALFVRRHLFAEQRRREVHDLTG
jgi:hypothetical protein